MGINSRVVKVEINGHDIRATYSGGKWFYCLNDICRLLLGGANLTNSRVFGLYDGRMVQVSAARQLEFIDDYGLFRLAFRGNTRSHKSAARWLMNQLRSAKITAASLSKMEQCGDFTAHSVPEFKGDE